MGVTRIEHTYCYKGFIRLFRVPDIIQYTSTIDDEEAHLIVYAEPPFGAATVSAPELITCSTTVLKLLH
jgi:hypothetical protein